jgi:hypothetical protein
MKGRMFVIGAPLSGIDALCELVSKLPPIFITLHVAAHSPGMLPYLLSSRRVVPPSGRAWRAAGREGLPSILHNFLTPEP